MRPDPPSPRRHHVIVAALVLVALLATVPGIHLLERWMPALPAKLASHGLGLALLGAAILRWRAARGRAARGRGPVRA